MIKKNIWAGPLLPIVCFLIPLYIMSISLMNYYTPLSLGFRLCCFFKTVGNLGLPLMTALCSMLFIDRETEFSLSKIRRFYLPAVIIICCFFWFTSAVLNLEYSSETESVQYESEETAAEEVYDKETESYDIDRYEVLESMVEVLNEPYNMRFYYLALVFIICYPMFFKISKSKKLSLYGLSVFFIMTIAQPCLEYIPYLNKLFLFTSQINMGDFTVFGFYMFMGFSMRYIKPKGYRTVMLCSLGMVCISLAYVLSINSFTSAGIDNKYTALSSPLTAGAVFAVLYTGKYLFSGISAASLPRSSLVYILFPGLAVPAYFFAESAVSIFVQNIVIGAPLIVVLTWLITLAAVFLLTETFWGFCRIIKNN